MVLGTEWAQVEEIEVAVPSSSSGGGYGFNIVGGRSTGVVVKSVCGALAGRLQPGDHLLCVDGASVRGYSAEQVAVVLRHAAHQGAAAGAGVLSLVVARPYPHAPTAPHDPSLVPTRALTDPLLLADHLLACAPPPPSPPPPTGSDAATAPSLIQPDLPPLNSTASQSAPTSPVDPHSHLPEVQIVHVHLNKNVYGLGITVAGFICEKEDLCGIFVKSIIEGSSAEGSGQININDRIIEVDGKSLLDKTNYEAVEILKNTGIAVDLVLERFLRGPRFEHLQLALFDDQRSSPEGSVKSLSWIQDSSKLESDTTTDNTKLEFESTHESCATLRSESDEHYSVDSVHEVIDSYLEGLFCQQFEHLEDLKQYWAGEVGERKEIIVCDVEKYGNLGISMEGMVEVEGGLEVRPRHYIRSVLSDSPVGRAGELRAGDQLLQVNSLRLDTLGHARVVAALRAAPRGRVRLVCARDPAAPTPRPLVSLAPTCAGFEERCIIAASVRDLTCVPAAPPTAPPTTPPASPPAAAAVPAVARWSSTEELVELEKDERGLGFSILDYQDPECAGGSVTVVRGVVEGGAAWRAGRPREGDRLLSVNGADIRHAPLHAAVRALKLAPAPRVLLGLARLLAPAPPPPPPSPPALPH